MLSEGRYELVSGSSFFSNILKQFFWILFPWKAFQLLQSQSRILSPESFRGHSVGGCLQNDRKVIILRTKFAA
jgi:hypothetical protein